MQVLIEISDEEYKKISNSNPSYADDFSIYYAIKNGTPIPDNVTNGEALCMLFPYMRYTLSDSSSRVITTIGLVSSFDVDWWNAPYKEESEE